jgi:hypothetical protein
LFEVLITLSILNVVLSLLYLTFHQSMMVMAETDDRAEAIQQGRLILEKAVGELRGLRWFPERGLQAYRTGLSAVPPKRGMSFWTAWIYPFAPSRDFCRGRWGCSDWAISWTAPRQKGLHPVPAPGRGADGDLLRGGRSLALCDRVRSLSFSYFDRLGRKAKTGNSWKEQRLNQLPPG